MPLICLLSDFGGVISFSKQGGKTEKPSQSIKLVEVNKEIMWMYG